MATQMTTTKPNDAANALAPQQPRKSLIETMAAHYGLEPSAFFDSVKSTVFSNKGSKAEMIAFLVVAEKYGLNPFIREIYAFPKKGGGIVPVVPIDGWLSIINRSPAFDGLEYVDNLNAEGDLISITCRIFRTDRSHAITCTEYMEECRMATDPWRKWPRRMLRHKATIQAGRIAFGLCGFIDEDEAARMEQSGIIDAPARDRDPNRLLESLPDHTDTGEESDHEHGDAIEGESLSATEQKVEDAPADPMAEEIAGLAILARAHGCPEAEAERWATNALDQEQPAEWLGTKPWAKKSKPGEQKTLA